MVLQWLAASGHECIVPTCVRLFGSTIPFRFAFHKPPVTLNVEKYCVPGKSRAHLKGGEQTEQIIVVGTY